MCTRSLSHSFRYSITGHIENGCHEFRVYSQDGAIRDTEKQSKAFWQNIEFKGMFLSV